MQILTALMWFFCVFVLLLKSLPAKLSNREDQERGNRFLLGFFSVGIWENYKPICSYFLRRTLDSFRLATYPLYLGFISYA